MLFEEIATLKSFDTKLIELGDIQAVQELCEQDVDGAILIATKLAIAKDFGFLKAGGVLWGQYNGSELFSLLWIGANVIPFVSPKYLQQPSLLEAVFSEYVLRTLRGAFGYSSIVGKKQFVDALWVELAGQVPLVRNVRERQPIMRYAPTSRVCGERVVVSPHPAGVNPVRYATMDDFEEVLFGSVDMFTSEIGYSPMEVSPGAYRSRIAEMIQAQRTLVAFSNDRKLIFKADIGARFGGIGQIQGVWVRREARNQGIATWAMRQLMDQLVDEFSGGLNLYVNDFNLAAMQVYSKCGFEVVGEYKTILF